MEGLRDRNPLDVGRFDSAGEMRETDPEEGTELLRKSAIYKWKCLGDDPETDVGRLVLELTT
jgi:hypothetical protein